MLAYFDCFAGISGDMTLAALIDLGLEPSLLEHQLSLLQIEGYRIDVSRSKRRGIAGIRFHVEVHADQPHRSYHHIRGLIAESALPDHPKRNALAIFDILAEAEARVHGVDKDHVHFHEVGAVDSIVDIVGVAVGIHALGIETIVCSPLPVGRGFVQTAHGTLPLPAPATMEILTGLPVSGTESSIELVTPTGAAIVRGLASQFGPYPAFRPIRVGYGLGKADPKDFPNALRVVLGKEEPDAVTRERIAVLECQVDDLDPRVLGDLMEFLIGRGVLDVLFSPVQMKKNRPGTLITVLTTPDKAEETSTVLLSHTTTLGVRMRVSERMVLDRLSEHMETSYGPVRVKVVTGLTGRTEKRCEFEEIRRIARETGRPAREILQELDRELNG